MNHTTQTANRLRERLGLIPGSQPHVVRRDLDLSLEEYRDAAREADVIELQYCCGGGVSVTQTFLRSQVNDLDAERRVANVTEYRV